MDHIKSDRERIEDKRVKTALLVAYTKAIKEASTDTKSRKEKVPSRGSKYDFAKALQTFKKTEKMCITTDVELNEVGSKITAEAWVGGRVINKVIGGHMKYIQLIADAEMDSPTKTAAITSSSIRTIMGGLDLAGGESFDMGKRG